MQKLTMLINATSGIPCGWSETLYTSLSDPSSTRSLCQAWMEARRQLLSGSYTILGVRISSDPTTPPVNSYVYYSSTEMKGIRAGGPDYPNTAPLVALRSGAAVEHRLFRGWADSDIAPDAANRVMRLGAEPLDKLNTYIGFLAGNALGWARQARNGDAGYIEVKVSAIASDVTNGNAELTSVYNGDWTGANKGAIRTRGFKQALRNLNGVFAANAYNIIGTVLTLPRDLGPLGVAGYVKDTARVIKQVLIYASIQGGAYERISSHRTGRPFAQLVGRR